ncbi:MAG TPA: DUF2852 domain-containing protein [Beijerinckiaceae bacterium]|jgi:hypothetical protein
MSFTAQTAWGPATGPWRHQRRRPSKGLEIAGIILGFVFFWPAALGYIAWKVMGYPVPKDWKSYFEANFARAFDGGPGRGRGFRSTGNLAFDEYRRGELERLEAERRRLEEEAQDFATFVEDLKRAKDREEFDAYMRRRRGDAPTMA